MNSVKNCEFRWCLCTFVASSETEFDSHIECSHSDIFNATFNQNGMSDPSKENVDELKNQESDLQEQHQKVQVQTNQKQTREDEKSQSCDLFFFWLVFDGLESNKVGFAHACFKAIYYYYSTRCCVFLCERVLGRPFAGRNNFLRR